MRDAITTRVTLVAVAVVTAAVAMVSPNAPPAVAPAPMAPNEMAPLTRPQIAAALAGVFAREPATLGPAFVDVQHTGLVVELGMEAFEARWALAERLQIQVLASRGSLEVYFYGGAAEAQATDELLAAIWGPGVSESECTTWVNRARQYQLHRCTTGGYGVPEQQHFEWSTYLAAEQWVGSGRELGFEPFRLLGATAAQMQAAIGEYASRHGLLRAPGHEIGWGVTDIGFELEDDRVVVWRASVSGDPRPIEQLLQAKWPGLTIEPGYEPDKIAGTRFRWVVGDASIVADFRADSVAIVVEELARVRNRERESARMWHELIRSPSR